MSMIFELFSGFLI